MSGTAITAKVQSPADPYDAADPRNRLALHRPDPMLAARRSAVGSIVLAEGSQFLQLAEAAGVNAAALVLELASVAERRPDILKCSHQSMIAFMLDAAKLDLTIGRGIYPVPVKGKLEGWVGYKGAKELACRGGAIRDAWATVRFEGDEFEMSEVPIPTVTKHGRGLNAGNMAKAVGVYCTLLYPGGRVRMKYFTRDKILSYKKRNASANGESSPWKTAEEEMWQAKAILHTVGDLLHSSKHMQHLREMLDREAAVATDLEDEPSPAPGLPAGDPTPPSAPAAEPVPQEEPFEETTPAEELEPAAMSLGAAKSFPITLKGGQVRMVEELRTETLNHVLAQARERLQKDPEHVNMKQVAEACDLVISARMIGTLREPARVVPN